MFFLKSITASFILLFSLLLLSGFITDSPIYAAEWDNDIQPPDIIMTIKCGGIGSAMSSGGECDKKTASVQIDYQDNRQDDTQIKNINYSVSPASIIAAPVSQIFPIPVPTAQVLDTITSTNNEVSAAINANATDLANNEAVLSPAFSIIFLGSWFKLKNASFHSLTAGDFINPIPLTVDAFGAGSGDDTRRMFIIGEAPNDPEVGVVSAVSNNVSFGRDNPDGTAVKTSTKGWQTNGYNRLTSLNFTSFLDYMKSRKDHKTITKLDGADGLDQAKINYWNGNLTLVNGGGSKGINNFDNKKVVLIIDGTLDFDNLPANKFTPAGTAATAFIARRINFYNGSNFLKQARGIFIADTIDFGNSDTELEIDGNVVSFAPANPTTSRHRTDSLRKPSIFVAFDPKMYLDLLPYLSISKYDWKQLQ